MIFSGYVFASAAHIAPFLERAHAGPTARFCAETAARLRCYVAAGYPERLPPAEDAAEEAAEEAAAAAATTEEEDAAARVRRVGANSAAVYGPDGAPVLNYRKRHLFRTDTTWAKPGTGFTTCRLPPLGRVALGICMDLNPHPPAVWAHAAGPYELAAHARASAADVLVLLNNWLDSGAADDPDQSPDWATLNYWAARLRPLWVREAEADDRHEDEDQSAQESGQEGTCKPVYVVICNRTGEENGVKFAGSSAILKLVPNSGRPILLHSMGRHEEGIRVWTI